ncbi:hypothetical protein Droror1_Dr00008543 [Drosera rotundifolia]
MFADRPPKDTEKVVKPGGCSKQSKWELNKLVPLKENGCSVEAALGRNLDVHYNSDQDRDDSGDEGDSSRKRAAVSVTLSDLDVLKCKICSDLDASLGCYLAKQVEQKKEDDCSICMGGFDAQRSMLLLGCSHVFHRECICPWLDSNSTCPLCRHELQVLTF